MAALDTETDPDWKRIHELARVWNEELNHPASWLRIDPEVAYTLFKRHHPDKRSR